MRRSIQCHPVPRPRQAGHVDTEQGTRHLIRTADDRPHGPRSVRKKNLKIGPNGLGVTLRRDLWPHWEEALTKAAIPSMMRCSPNRKERAGSWAAPYSAPA